MEMKLLQLVSLMLVFASVSSSEARPECDSPLSGSVPDHRWDASSTTNHTQFGPHLGRLGNSGWCSSMAKGEKEFIQLDLGQDMRVTALTTSGVWVKNESTGNHTFMYVSQYFLAYKRDGDTHWRRYHRNDVSVTLFSVNLTGQQKHYLQTPRIARYVQIVIDRGVGNRWCLKVEVHGCPWTQHDGLISYRISQGNYRKNLGRGRTFLRDNGYDGTRLAFGTKVGMLYGGLGQMTDGVLGRNAAWNETANPNWIDWIGWLDAVTMSPTVTFHFSSLRKFSAVRLYILNHPGHREKLLFSKVVISFSKDGEYFAWKTIYEPSMAKRTSLGNKAFWIRVNLEGNIGKDVTCDFLYYGWWVLISEVEFESVEVSPGNLLSATPPTSISNITVDSDDSGDTTDEIKVEESGKARPPFNRWNFVLVACLIAGSVALLLLCVVVTILWRRKKRVGRDQDRDDFNRVSLRIINPQKKNSLNRRNDSSTRKFKMLDKAAEDEEEEVDLMVEEKCNLNNARSRGLREELVKANEHASRNLRPESKEISLEEEKAEVLAEMRKLSEGQE